MKSLAEQLAEYHNEHATPLNKLTHCIGISATLVGILILLNWVWVSFGGYWNITFAWLLIIGLLVYYYLLDVKLAAVMTVLLVILTLICAWIAYPAPTTASLILFLIFFIGGLALQFIGQSIEKSKPTFYSHISQVLIAPMFALAECLKMLHLGKYFGLEESEPTSNKKDNG